MILEGNWCHYTLRTEELKPEVNGYYKQLSKCSAYVAVAFVCMLAYMEILQKHESQ